MHTAIVKEYKYGDEKFTETKEFESQNALNEFYYETKKWLETDKGCFPKWFLIVQFSDGRNLSGEVNL